MAFGISHPELGMQLKELKTASTLDQLKSSGKADSRRDSYNQMDVIWHDSKLQNLETMPLAQDVQNYLVVIPVFLLLEYLVPVLRYPDQMVNQLVFYVGSALTFHATGPSNSGAIGGLS